MSYICIVNDIDMKRITIFIIICTLLSACVTRENNATEKTIFVTITPLKRIVEEITCGDFRVEVLVPEGASPETFEPTARQLTSLNNASKVYAIGLIDFEQSLIANLDESRIVDLSEGIETMEGSCSHGHKHHSHGIDPHTWTSPRALKTMARTIERSIMAEYPDSAKYSEAADRLVERIEALDSHCQESVERSNTQAILIYHPAYTYYTRDYGIRQIAIEHDGKEPSPRQLKAIIEEALTNNIRTILLQPQYSIDKVATIAKECQAEVVVTNPLAEDILLEIQRVTYIMCRSNE